jgi:hypothetical protein
LIASSWLDAYEMALNKKCNLGGPSGEAYMKMELSLSGFDIEIVTPEVFAKLVKDQKRLGNG